MELSRKSSGAISMTAGRCKTNRFAWGHTRERTEGPWELFRDPSRGGGFSGQCWCAKFTRFCARGQQRLVFNENSSDDVKYNVAGVVSTNVRCKNVSTMTGGAENKGKGGEKAKSTRIGNYESILRKILNMCVSCTSFDGKAISPETFAPRQVPLKSSETPRAAALWN